MSLVDWQRKRMAQFHNHKIDYGIGRGDVTILAYHFWRTEGYDEAFLRVECAIRETWHYCGTMKTVVVTNQVGQSLASFAEKFSCVEVQVEESLVPGQIFSMSADCNSRLYTRFETPYVLIVQNDGFPLRKGLDEFVGKWDFIGAPYVRKIWWKRLGARLLDFRPMNGGFSLRSRRCCELAASLWNAKYHEMGDCHWSSEDLFVTQFLPKHERDFRKSVRFPDAEDAMLFSFEAIEEYDGKFHPFGFHADRSFEAISSYCPL